MPLRRTVDDAMRRWLMLQQDFGGDEILLNAPIDLAAILAAGDRSLAGPADSHLAPSLPPSMKSPGDAAGWRKGAPPIPPRGLTVVSDRSLLDDAASAWASLDEIAAAVRVCPKCALCRTRTYAVPGEGNPQARLMLVGEGPGESEDRTGRPFVGRAGELLDKILANIEVPRADAYIANVVKCRPPQNRVPLPDERDACMPYLQRQIGLIRPSVLLALGSTAAQALLGVKASLGQLRLKVHEWNGIPLIVTYHPAALLRNPDWKRPAWDDVRIARQLLDRRA